MTPSEATVPWGFVLALYGGLREADIDWCMCHVLMFCLQVQVANNEALSLHGKAYHDGM
jgi:hypothetical protein